MEMIICDLKDNDVYIDNIGAISDNREKTYGATTPSLQKTSRKRVYCKPPQAWMEC